MQKVTVTKVPSKIMIQGFNCQIILCTRVASSSANGFFGDDVFGRFLFRQAQFYVAAETNVTLAAEVATRWKAETIRYEPIEAYQYSRILLLTTLLLKVEVPIDPRELIYGLRELLELTHLASNVLPSLLPTSEEFGRRGQQLKDLDTVQILFSFFWARSKDVSFLEGLLQGLAEQSSEFLRPFT
jgi:hypothetical protein